MSHPGYLLVATLFVHLVVLAGCDKCYHCYTKKGDFIAIKGVDSIRFVASSKGSIGDSVTRYCNLGYRIDTLSLKAIQDPNYGDLVCFPDADKKLSATGDSCVLLVR